MILPNKYLSIEESCIGISGLLINCIGKKFLTIDKLWASFERKYANKLGNKFPAYQKFIFTVDFMYMTSMISYNDDGEIYNENLISKN
ncbi:hypothetical protein P7D98_08175 [Enterococcus avium]|uniref:ABC-three component system middle component 6 n=1 Tax=Enterococcus avium TaxID=33945 RepID=UPI00288D018F|nr:ABC-three component system middle component 6 [Enterococcus avium]MDT2435622.1 hypothetical protein [Enterococcus avium]MDT2448275.1 hypothetical protein [Enterococcus avium]MDT2465634.1 hypothetical protein [Enterococcus avium]MDT2482715.1 hypothetical protein [Enterococcus avium]MDT2505061.1 hypothetical protein [Enterococcus avium]